MRPHLLALVACAALTGFGGEALAQAGAAGAAACKPATQPPMKPVPTVAPGAPARPGEAARPAIVAAIPGVVAPGVAWHKVWQGGGNSADGILPADAGAVLVAQEDFDTVLRIAPDGASTVAIADAKGLGSLSMDRQGRLYGAHRTERPGSTKPDAAAIPNAITILAPKRQLLADAWADGGALTIRPNDLAADGHGGAFFTSGCLYYADAKGAVVVAEGLRTNGIVFSPDDRTLYVTNGPAIVAFDVLGPGRLGNRRDFAMLPAGGPGDGLAVDSQGRLYVTSPPGVQVFAANGQSLGLIPTPRAVISLAFAGTDRKLLYVVGSGAEDVSGQPIRQGPQQTAATVYALPTLAQGPPGRAK